MANLVDVRPTKKTIDLGDGVEREVVVTLNALAELEEKYGSIDAAFQKVEEGSIAAIRFLLWCVLVPDGEEEMTERQIGKLITLNNLNALMSDLMDIFTEFMPAGATTESADPNIVPLANNWE